MTLVLDRVSRKKYALLYGSVYIVATFGQDHNNQGRRAPFFLGALHASSFELLKGVSIFGIL